MVPSAFTMYRPEAAIPLPGPAPWLESGVSGRAAAPPTIAAPDTGAATPLATLLTQIIVVVVAARFCGRLSARIGQPKVIGEIVAGILLGPSLLGWVAPAVSLSLFPPARSGP
jgi:hypothetical protein